MKPDQEQFMKDISITDYELLDCFIDTNCFIRLAVMKRLANYWSAQNEQKRYALAIVFIEQFMALLESVEMLLFAMIKKGSDNNNSLFSYYKSIQIKESNLPKDKSINTLRNAFKGMQSNIEFCGLLGIDVNKLPVNSNGTEFKESIDIIIDFLENYRSKIPLVQTYNSIKHGMLVRLKKNNGDMYIEPILKIKSIGKTNSCATVTGFTTNEELLNTLIKNAEMFSKNFQALCAIIKAGYIE